MKRIFLKLLSIFGMALIWIIVSQLIPDKYILSAMGIIGWWSCLIWFWMFPSKRDKALKDLYNYIKEIRKDGGLIVHATKEQSQEFLDKINKIKE